MGYSTRNLGVHLGHLARFAFDRVAQNMRVETRPMGDFCRRLQRLPGCGNQRDGVIQCSWARVGIVCTRLAFKAFQSRFRDADAIAFEKFKRNAHVILRSEQYESRSSALNVIASVQKNSPDSDRYELKTASDGRPFFNLRAANSQVIGTTQIYASEASRANGVEAVKTNGPSIDVREV